MVVPRRCRDIDAGRMKDITAGRIVCAARNDEEAEYDGKGGLGESAVRVEEDERRRGYGRGRRCCSVVVLV